MFTHLALNNFFNWGGVKTFCFLLLSKEEKGKDHFKSRECFQSF